MAGEAKKVVCPDCSKEVVITEDGYCPECDYPFGFHEARRRVKAVEDRERKKAEEEAEKNKPPKKRRGMFGGAI